MSGFRPTADSALTIVVGVSSHASSQRACSAAFDLARATGATVHLVDAVDSTSTAEGDAFRQAEGLLASFALSTAIPVVAHTVIARADRAIIQVARQVGADLIVVGNKGLVRRRRLSRSAPQRVLRDAPCSVLVVDTRITHG